MSFLSKSAVKLFSPVSCLQRFSRERRVCFKSPVSRATQTTVSVWVPAAVARIRARSCVDHWALPLCSRCVARRQHHQESSVPWKQAKERAWSRATSALRRWLCVCLQASPSSWPACYSTSSWSEGIFNYRIERESKIAEKKTLKNIYERTEWNQNKHLRCTFNAIYDFFGYFLIQAFPTLFLLSFAFTHLGLFPSPSLLSSYHCPSHLLRISVEGSLVWVVPRLGKKADNQALK